MTEQPTPFDRALGGYVAVVLVLLFIAFGGCGGLLSEARAALQGAGGAGYTYSAGPGYTGRAALPSDPYSQEQTAAIMRAAPAVLGRPVEPPAAAPAPPLLAGGGAPATASSGAPADPGPCINGRNSYGIECGVEPLDQGGDGRVHYYPPAHPDQPCQQADGAIRFTRITETGNTETFTRAPQWSSDRSTYTVVLPGGAAPVLFVGPPPACGGAP